MIHIFICDDDLIHQKRISNIIENYNLFHNNRLILQGIFSSPEALLQYLPLIHTVPETTVFLLDIELQGRLSGLELGKKINETFPDSYLIFITGHRDLCYLTFELQLKTFNYITKTDISFMERVVSCMDRLQATIDTKPVMARPYFTYRTGSTTNRILEDHIYYFTVSSNSHKVIMYTKYKNVDFYNSLKNISLTVSDNFIFCHNAYLINKNHIMQYDKNERNILFDNGYICPVSIRYQKNVQAFI